jgi:hypothetical protein
MAADPENIPDEIVESACETIAGFSDDEARGEITRLNKAQPALLAYVMAETEELGNDAKELALYMFVVVYRMYEMHFGKRLQNVGVKLVEEIRDRNADTMESLLGADEGVLMEAAISQSAHQPAVMQYVGGCLFEPADEEDVELSDDEQGAVFIVLKTVIDALDSSVGAV